MNHGFEQNRRVARMLFVVVGAIMTTSGCSTLSRSVQPSGGLPDAATLEHSPSEDTIGLAIAANREQALLLAAEERWRSGDPLDCEKLLQRLLESSPESRDGLQMLAELHLATDRPEMAMEELSVLLQEDGESLDLKYHYAVALEAAGRQTEADRHFAGIARVAGPNSWLAELPRSFGPSPTLFTPGTTVKNKEAVIKAASLVGQRTSGT